MQFLVEFADDSTHWLPWSRDISDTIQFEDFCRAHQLRYSSWVTPRHRKTMQTLLSGMNDTSWIMISLHETARLGGPVLISSPPPRCASMPPYALTTPSCCRSPHVNEFSLVYEFPRHRHRTVPARRQRECTANGSPVSNRWLAVRYSPARRLIPDLRTLRCHSLKTPNLDMELVDGPELHQARQHGSTTAFQVTPANKVC